MSELIILEVNAEGKQGVSFTLNKKVSFNRAGNGLKCNKVWFSWDSIGRALYPDEYTTVDSVAELDELRAKGDQS